MGKGGKAKVILKGELKGETFTGRLQLLVQNDRPATLSKVASFEILSLQ